MHECLVLSYRCQTLCLRYYNSEALSLIFSCSHSTETNSYNILAQLPMTVITSLPMNIVNSDQLINTSLTTWVIPPNYMQIPLINCIN